LAQESQLQDYANISTGIESDSEDIEAVCAAINSLGEECGQINELAKLEEYYSREIIDQLKQIMMPGKASFTINLAAISTSDSSVTDAVLTSEGIVCLQNHVGKVLLRRPLREFQGETFLNIVDDILLEVKNIVYTSQEKPSERLSTIEKISRELRKIVRSENTRNQRSESAELPEQS
jgi:hypothetical protein